MSDQSRSPAATARNYSRRKPIGGLVDGHPGVVRLSSTFGSSGQGTDVAFLVALDSSSWGGCLPSSGAAEPFDHLDFRFDTADDDLASGSELDYELYGFNADHTCNTATALETGVVHNPGDESYEDQTEWTARIQTAMPRMNICAVGLTMTPHGSDEWHVENIDVNGTNGAANGHSTCIVRGQPGPETLSIFGNGLKYDYTFNGSNPSHVLQGGCD